ncbi:hypothetical protein ACPUD8_12580 [Brevibacterium sp. FAM 25378]|uniref:hypothetical protein n=1 Tax=unclassified Brevibacterium TaxID=2614124 RepID=UPI00109275AE|nr:hypothetical protein [Brevibacterium sp. S22]TGD31224.1 hypothetical protein EB835_08820 [Brevibacterium sp. S22]
MSSNHVPWRLELRRVPLDRLESHRDYLARRLDYITGDDYTALATEYRATATEVRRRYRTTEIERAQRAERFHPDHYQPPEHRSRRGRKRRRRFNRNLPH